MYCKHCKAPLEKGAKVCPGCGRKIPALWKLIVATVACVLLLAVLVLMVLGSMGIKIRLVKPKPANDIFYKNSYTATAEQAVKNADTVVATVANRELTNGELQLYYWSIVFDHLDTYGNYYFSPYQPLEDQIMDSTTGKTWQQFFLEASLTTWQRYELLSLLAEKEGHELATDLQEYMETLSENLEASALESGYENADAMLQDDMGPGCFFRHYAAYMTDYCIGLDYFETLYAQLSPTDGEIESYFEANRTALESSGITKDSGLQSTVCHILIEPEGVTDDDGNTTYTEEDWNNCLKEAEALLEQWKQGDATEESFSELAKLYSVDPGVVQNAGYYEGVSPISNYVDTFRTWSVDPTHQPGDTGIVRSQYGYHIMYFVSGEDFWYATCQEEIVSQRVSDLLDETAEANALKVDYKKITLGDALGVTE